MKENAVFTQHNERWFPRFLCCVRMTLLVFQSLKQSLPCGKASLRRLFSTFSFRFPLSLLFSSSACIHTSCCLPSTCKQQHCCHRQESCSSDGSCGSSAATNTLPTLTRVEKASNSNSTSNFCLPCFSSNFLSASPSTPHTCSKRKRNSSSSSTDKAAAAAAGGAA